MGPGPVSHMEMKFATDAAKFTDLMRRNAARGPGPGPCMVCPFACICLYVCIYVHSICIMYIMYMQKGSMAPAQRFPCIYSKRRHGTGSEIPLHLTKRRHGTGSEIP